MKTRLTLIALILIAVGGGSVWYYNQPEQKISRVVDQFIGAVEYDSTKLRSRDDVHEAVRATTRESIKLKVSELPFNIQVPDEMAFNTLCSRLDLLHNMTSEREFKSLEQEVKVIKDKAQLTRIAEITMAAPLQERKTEAWKLVFDLELKGDWKITAIRARRHQ